MSLTSVRVSWQGLLEQPECADKIVVKPHLVVLAILLKRSSNGNVDSHKVQHQCSRTLAL